MKPALFLILLFIAGSAVLLSIDPKVDPGQSLGSSAPSVPLLAPSDALAGNEVDQAPADPTTDPGASAAELDRFEKLFAAEPALIDALEDAGSADPAVRADAEELLWSFDLQAAETAANAAANAAR